MTVYTSFAPLATEIPNPEKVIVFAPALYTPVTLLTSLPFNSQVTLARSASVVVPVTLTTICEIVMALPSAVPPSLRVKSKTPTASPIVSIVVSKPIGSITPAAAVKLPSVSIAALISAVIVKL